MDATSKAGDIAPFAWLDRRWKLGVLAAWLLLSIVLIVARWQQIDALWLSDTDDNLRLASVRALLDGQGWFDMRQYRLAPPLGADVHWSRIVDLPIAALIVLLEPLIGTAAAERWAIAIAPLLAFGLGLFSISLIVRRLVDPRAWPIGIAIALCAHIALGMWSPTRIDHHGWQLALLMLTIAGLVDADRLRGGIVAGLASAVSLAIGLEMLIYLAVIGGLFALLWVRDEGEARGLQAYGATLAGGCALGFLLFASTANQAPVCDALSPVWLAALWPAGAALVVLPMLPLAKWPWRLAAAALAGGAIAACFAALWPQCVADPFGASEQLRQLWLDNVREAKPIQRHPWRSGLRSLALPVIGIAGCAVMMARTRGTPAALPWLVLSLLSLISIALLFVQMRFAPGAQLIGVAGATALAWSILGRVARFRSPLVRVASTLAVLALVSGYFTVAVEWVFPEREETAANRETRRDSVRCRTEAALAPVAALPRGLVLTQVDLGPRLVVMTPHNAIAGPYHRNGQAIVEVMTAFEGDGGSARAVIARRGVDYVLVCPSLGETRLYQRAGDDSFVSHLIDGEAPPWLERVPLPEGSPLMMWRVEPR